MRKPTICLCENKGADQLRSKCEADQRLCFGYTDRTIPLLLNPKFPVSSHLLCLHSPVCVGPGRKPQRPVPYVAAHIFLFACFTPVLVAVLRVYFSGRNLGNLCLFAKS